MKCTSQYCLIYLNGKIIQKGQGQSVTVNMATQHELNDEPQIEERSYGNLQQGQGHLDVPLSPSQEIPENLTDSDGLILTFKVEPTEDEVSGPFPTAVFISGGLGKFPVSMPFEGLRSICSSNMETPPNPRTETAMDMNTEQRGTLSPVKRHKCLFCDYGTDKLREFKAHIRRHTKERLFKCSVCSYTTSRQGTLHQHMKQHKTERPHKCLVCGYSCIHKYQLIQHCMTHTEEKPFKCSVCDKRYYWNSDLENHMSTHTDGQSYRCPLCTKCFNGMKGLHQHMRIRHSTKVESLAGEKPYKCQICDYSSTRRTDVNKHALTHSREEPFECTLCDYKSRWKNSLKAHMSKHSGEIPFLCSICGNTFARKYNLEEHMNTHALIKPFNCSLCEYNCTQKGLLRKHMKSHTENKPFVCPVCDYSCVTKYLLDKHMIRHTDVKAYECSICETKFKRSGDLTVHMKNQHSGNRHKSI